MTKHKLLEPRVTTPATGVRESTRSYRLPDALISEQLQRLAIASVVGAGLWSYGLVMDTLVRPYTLGWPVPAINVGIEIFSIALAGLMFLYVRYAPRSAQAKTNAGQLFFVLNAVAVAVMNNWALALTHHSSAQLSWSTVVILVASMILPSTPRKMLATATIAASMDPLIVWAGGNLRGLDVPSLLNTLVFFMPNYACAVVAVLPSSVLHRLGRQLRRAQELGSYHLVELLGRGGMGEVWRGEHRLLARNAAIKLVRPELLGASSEAEALSMLRRFEREAQSTAALNSPHTIRLYDFGVTADKTFYYVMELLSGRDLESLVREFGPVRADRAVFLLRQVAHSLAEAHARGLVHRDITPSNIYVCRMGLDYDFVKVLDFGLATANPRQTADHLLTTSIHTTAGLHTTVGTPAFMAPEIVVDGTVDERTDVYAFGCVAYFLLTGQLLFDAPTPMKMFVDHLQVTPLPPSQRSELPIPRELDALVMACLEKDPNRRPQNATQLMRKLGELRTGDTWNSELARRWWEGHLVELTMPELVSVR